MSEKNIRIGIAGCGWIADKAHVPAFINIEGTKVCSVFDIDGERAANLASKYNIHGVYDDYEEFLRSNIDAVIVATPNHTHADYSIKALERGIHVLCEKPAALSAEEIRDAARAARRGKSLYMPGFVNRFRYDIRKLRDMVREKRVGDITGISCGWLRRAGMPRPGTWFTNRKYSGGGVLTDLGSHVLDICLMLLGNAQPYDVSLSAGYSGEAAKAGAEWFESGMERELPVDVEDTATGSIKFEGGVSIDFKLSWSAPVKGDFTYFNIKGERGSIGLKTLFGFSNDRLWKSDSLTISEKGSAPYEINLGWEFNNTGLAFYNMANSFVNAIRGIGQGLPSFDDAIRCVELIQSLYRSENREGLSLDGMKWDYAG